ncbi:hypothetical protein BB561_000726 [Smittium simulii]|uniref:Conserved oligomeric Golgi complex subunit 3 n=1 Tax=Smittium simulii TaxID=133385 RepID=A0A2T9YY05_9FUNG|nr:hypothetical protein BB561_000726 [Smittium simulii]
MLKHWTKRKRLFKDMFDTITENYNGKPKALLEQLGVETDEDSMSSTSTSAYSIIDDWEKQISLDPILRDGIIAARENSSLFGFRASVSINSFAFESHHKDAEVLTSTAFEDKVRDVSPDFKANKETSSPKTLMQQPDSLFRFIQNKKIKTTVQFLEWFEKLEYDISSEQDAEINELKTELSEKSQLCKDILDNADDILNILTSALEAHKKIADQEALFKDSIKPFFVLKESKDTIQQELIQGLKVFNSLEEISKLFNSPGNNVCTEPRFLPFLEKTDLCIAFLQNNRYIRDAELYLLRFRQCQTRALTLIKMHFFQKVKELALIEKPYSINYLSNLNKFRYTAPEIKPLITAIELRVEHVAEANYLLFSMYKHYFSSRKQILINYIADELEIIKNNITNSTNTSELPSNQIFNTLLEKNMNFHDEESNKNDKSSDIQVAAHTICPEQEKSLNDNHLKQANMLHSWCTFIFNICSNEYHLLDQFFNANMDFKTFSYTNNLNSETDSENTGPELQKKNLVSLAASMFLTLPNNYLANQLTSEMIEFLESFLSVLYNSSRPLIISEHNISALCSYSRVLQSFAWASVQYNHLSTRNSLDYSQFNKEPLPGNNTESSSLDTEITLGLSMDLCTTTFYSMIDKLLGDTLHRLVFRIQNYIEDYISNYMITESDYSLIEEWYNTNGTKTQQNEHEETKRTINNDLQEFGDKSSCLNDLLANQFMESGKAIYVFPPISYTLWILEKIKESLTKNLIEDLSNESISACKTNITVKTAKHISEKYSHSPMAHSFVTFSLQYLDISLKSMERH